VGQNRDEPPPERNRAVTEILESIPPEGQSDRLRRLDMALATVRQEARILSEEIANELKRLGLSPAPNSKPDHASTKND
jgi:hypothetical protein